MAKAQTAEGTENGTAEGAVATAETEKRDRSYIVVPLPADVKTRFEGEAKAADSPVGPYVRNLLFGFLGIPVPVGTTARRSKYASAEDRDKAQKARNQTRSQTMRTLMAQFRKAQAAGMTDEEAAAAAGHAVAAGVPEPAPEGEPVTA